MASSKIYLRDKDGLVAMAEAPYDAEEVLQRLLADYPDLLAGDQMRPKEPRRWLLITREAGIPDAEGGQPRWSLDHLFIDQDAVPTLVEVKRSSDTRLRREVIGQMLDYAANVVAYWPGSQLRQLFEERPRPEGVMPDDEVLSLLGVLAPGDADAAHAVDEYWQRATSNLAARQIWLVFVADIIPPELQRIVEFLNENLVRAEVLAVEVKQYIGEGRQTLVPRVIGRTAAAEDVKQTSGTSTTRVVRTWTEPEFLEAVPATGGPDADRLVRDALAWNRRHGSVVTFGKGKVRPRLSHGWRGRRGPGADREREHAGPDDGLLRRLGQLRAVRQVGLRIELNNRLNEIAGVQIPERYAVDARWPSIHLAVLAPEASRAKFFEVLDWVAARLTAESGSL